MAISHFSFGQSIDNNPASALSALSAIGGDWTTHLTTLRADAPDGSEVIVPDNFGVLRSDNNSVLGVVGNRYTTIQNSEAFEFMDSLLPLGANIVGGGDFGAGRKVFLQAHLGDLKIENKHFGDDFDMVRKYLLVVNSHDGSSPLRAFATNIRVVCQNTLMAAIRNQDNGVNIRHTANAKSRMAEAVRVWRMQEQYNEEFAQVMQTFADTDMSASQMRAFIEELMPAKADSKVSTRGDNTRNEIANLFTEGKGNAGKTVWDAWNAVTEYVDHHRGTRLLNGAEASETRKVSSLWGSGANLRQEAMDLLLDFAQVR